MSVEQINLIQLQGLLPTVKFCGMMLMLVVAVWFGTMALCVVVEKVKNKIDKRCTLARAPH